MLTEYFTRVTRTHPKLPVSVLLHLRQQPKEGERSISIQAALPNINFPDKIRLIGFKSAFSFSLKTLANGISLFISYDLCLKLT